MCRLLAARAENPGAVGALRALLRAFLEAARRDPRLHDAYGAWRHCDGYGYVLLADRGRGWEIHYERADAYEAASPGEACTLNLEGLEAAIERLSRLLIGAHRAYLVLHARKASPSMPRGPLSAHPYRVPLMGGVMGELYLAHNGGVDRAKLASDACIPAGLRDKLTDSHALAIWLARKIEEGLDPKEALRLGAAYVTSAYVVAMLLLERNRDTVEPHIYYSNILSQSTMSSDKKRAYYEARLAEANGLAVLASPTVADYKPSLPWERAGEIGELGAHSAGPEG